MVNSVPQQPAPHRSPPHQQQQQRPLLPAAHHFPAEPSPLFLTCLVLGLTTSFLLFHRYRHSIFHFLSPDSDPRSLSETEQNTDRNRRQEGEESDSGAPLLPRRRGLRHRSFSDDGEEEDGKEKMEDEFKMVSKPVPAGVKSCIKRSASPLSSPSPSSVPPSRSIADSPPSRSDTPSPTPRKTVRVVDPSSERASLEALREFWAAPGVHGASSSGGGGIAGYRRTRDIYARGQGGTALIKRGVVKLNEGSAPTEEGNGGAGTESETTTSDESGAEASSNAASKLEPRRSPRLSIPSSSIANAARSTSLSPSPSPNSRLRGSSSPTSPSARTASPSPLANSTLHATTSHVRAASPSFIVGKTARGASPSPARMPNRKRTTSREGGLGGVGKEEAVEAMVTPRWVRNKEGKGKGLARGGGEVAEKEEEKEVEQQGAAGEDDRDTDDGFEDVSASDVSGSSTPVLEPVLLPPLDGVTGEERPTGPSSTASPFSISAPAIAPSLAAPAFPPASSAPSSTATAASDARYPLRSRESTPSACSSSKPSLPSPSPSSPASTRARRGSLTLPPSPTNSTALLIGSPAAAGPSSPKGRPSGAVVVL